MSRKPRTTKPAATVVDEKNVIALRKLVRTVLSALPEGRRLTKPALSIRIEQDLGFPHTAAELDQAVEWNHARNFVDFQTDDFENDAWYLTEKGAAK